MPRTVSLDQNPHRQSLLGTVRTMIVSGDEGLDELSLAGGNEIADVPDLSLSEDWPVT